MVKVSLTNECKYGEITYAANEIFVIEDKDKEEFIKLGAVIYEEKVKNERKAEEQKVETNKTESNNEVEKTSNKKVTK